MILSLFCLTWVPANGTPFTYHTESSLGTDLTDLDNTFPSIVELSTFQSAFGLAQVPDGGDMYDIHFVRITNESTGLNKPEVLIMGGQHGDEKSGTESVYYLAETLANQYGTNDLVTWLVDHREIYLVPLVNPFGHVHHQRGDEDGEDLNRDYSYDPSGTVYSGIGSEGVHELSRRHLFVTMADFHSGVELICHPWGSPGGAGQTHISPNNISPDDVALSNLASLLSLRGGSFSGFLPTMTCHDLAPVFGPVDDYSYAAGWDTALSDPSWPTKGSRSLSYTVEISSSKTPSESTLGGSFGLFDPGGAEDGYVPKGVRIAMVLIDMAQPYVRWVKPPPAMAFGGEEITIAWEVGGALFVDQTDLRYGIDPDPAANPDFDSPDLFGGTIWDGTVFTQTITLPNATGEYHFTARARVDQSTAGMSGNTVLPQSIFVQMRTDANYSISNDTDPSEINTVTGSLDWFSETGTVTVTPSVPVFPSLWSMLALAFLFTIPLIRKKRR